MLMNLHKTKWTSGLTLKKFEDVQDENEKTVAKMLKLSKDYNERVIAEEGKTQEELIVESAGKVSGEIGEKEGRREGREERSDDRILLLQQYN